MRTINRNILIAYALKYRGEYRYIYEAIKRKEVIDEVIDIDAITILDDDYPKRLLELKFPPLVLFYKGNRALLNGNCVGVVGSRKICDYAKRATEYIVSNIMKEYTIVSGMAIGVDTVAHKTAICNRTIAILGSGIDYIYPKINTDLYNELINNHLVISEYPNNVKPFAYHFPFRNRIIAGLSDRLYVMQSEIKSGTLTTVNEMLELNKEIYALPYSIFDINGKGTNKLIQDGANMILIDDLLQS